MSQSQAMRSAFGAVFRQPTIYLAEFVWRATFAITAALLAFYALIGYLDSMEVTDADLFGIFGFVPGTARAALTHIFQGSGPALVRTVVAVVIGAGLLWLVLASVGESATLSALLGSKRPAFRTVAAWNLARLSLVYLTIAALVGAAFVAFARSQLTDGSHDPGRFYTLALPLWFLIMAVSGSIRSVVSVESLRRIRGAAFEWRSARGQFVWVAFATGVMRTLLWAAALFAFFIILGMALQAPTLVAWLLIVMSALVYTAASTLIHLLRLAGYVRVLTWEAEPPKALAAVV
jgi:hypothetical protein